MKIKICITLGGRSWTSAVTEVANEAEYEQIKTALTDTASNPDTSYMELTTENDDYVFFPKDVLRSLVIEILKIK